MQVGIIMTAVVGAILFPIVIILIYLHYYRKVPPDQVMVVSGVLTGDRHHPDHTVISGGGRFIIPFGQVARYLPVDVRTRVISARGIPVKDDVKDLTMNVKVVTQFRIDPRPELVHNAVDHFLTQSDQEMDRVAFGILEASLREVISGHTFREVNRDRDRIAVLTLENARKRLDVFGLEVRSLVLMEIDDDWDYLNLMGKGRTLEVMVRAGVPLKELLEDPGEYWSPVPGEDPSVTAERLFSMGRSIEGFHCPYGAVFCYGLASKLVPGNVSYREERDRMYRFIEDDLKSKGMDTRGHPPDDPDKSPHKGPAERKGSDERRAFAFNEYARSLMGSGDSLRAVTYFRKAFDLDPGNPEYLANMNRAIGESGTPRGER